MLCPSATRRRRASFVPLCPASLLAAVVTLASAFPARAEVAPQHWTLAAALAQAEAAAPNVALAHHGIREAEARRVGAGVVMPVNPRLSVDARPALTGGAYDNVGYGATLDALFEVGGAPAARTREADAHAGVARADLGTERANARARAFAAYIESKIAEQRIEEGLEVVRILEQVAAATETRRMVGAAGDLESATTALELAQARAANEALASEHEERLMELREALDLPSTQPLSLTTALFEPREPEPLAQLVERALASRPELHATRARLDLLAAADDRLAREITPRVGGYLGVDASPLSPVFATIGISIELPIAQRNQGPLAVVARAEDTERSRLAADGRRIAREVTRARAAFERRIAELRVLRESAVPAATRTYELAEAGWRAGRFDVFRVTTARRDLTRVIAQRLDVLGAAWRERIALDRAVGEVSS